MKALVIMEEPLEKILAGQKIWEMRKRRCLIRGPIALIRKGSGLVVGTAVIADSLAPITDLASYGKSFRFHRVAKANQRNAFVSGYRFPWLISRARRLRKPIPYTHTPGAMSWVTLSPRVAAQLPTRRYTAKET